ncbi:MAG: ATP-binding protein [Ruminococcaceae bacterium]|nr:ATP-binding protein [Oscillospiraceae bacterium]
MINIITGHYGSGKTEFALNLALKKRAEGKKVIICDLDIVNPYFRTSDVRKFLEDKGIRVIASAFASSNVDIPTLPEDVLSVFADDETEAILDVGGDDDGAVALGGYFNYITKKEFNMFFVINTLRPMTSKVIDILELARNIEITSRLKITHIINNTNLAYLTEEKHILESFETVEECAEKMNVPIKYILGKEEFLKNLPERYKDKAFKIETYMNLPF